MIPQKKILVESKMEETKQEMAEKSEKSDE